MEQTKRGQNVSAARRKEAAVEVGEASGRGRVLVVDDDRGQRRVLRRLLSREGFDCEEVADVTQALDRLARDRFDLVITDLDMPGASGMSLIETLANDYRDTATVMVTGRGDSGVGRAAIEHGAYGYLSKPIAPDDATVTALNAIRRRDLERENRRHREHLEEMVRQRTAKLSDALRDLERTQEDLRDSQSETIERLARAAEHRDAETATHLDRMSRYCEILATRCGIDAERSMLIRLASVMHDIGKIGIPDAILLKPGRLTPEEYRTMQSHAAIGHAILTGSRWELLQVAASVAYTHHEHYDGSGYPRGIAENAIPIQGRIAAIADVFDALTSHRVYRKAYELPEALDMMREGRGTHFDPPLLDAFFDAIDVVLSVQGP